MTSAVASGADAAAVAAAKLAVLIAVAQEIFAATLIGFTVSTILYGISVLQVYLYVRRYKDRWTLRSMVAALWSLDTAATVLQALALSEFAWNFIEGTPDISIPMTFSAEKGVVTIITFISQCFYAHTIWQISQKNRVVTAIIVFLTLSSFGIGIYTTYHLFTDTALESISSRNIKITTGLVQGLAALDDIAITFCMSYYLHIRRTGLPSAEKLLDTLILYAVSRGTLTAIAQTMFLILNIAVPKHVYWLPFHMIVGKLYVNSVFMTLNVRQSLTQTEVQLGHGISVLGRDSQMVDSTVTKPIAFTAMAAPRASFVSDATTFGTISQMS
jgi:hypothetical protein